MKKVIIVGLLALLFIGGVIGIWTAFATHEVTLTESFIQSKVDAFNGKTFELSGVKKIVMNSVRVEDQQLKIGEKITINATLIGTRRLKEYVVKIEALGVPEYHDGQFFFRTSNVKILEHGDLGINAKYEPWVLDFAEEAISKTLKKIPVYSLKDDVKGTVMKASLKSIDVANSTIHVTFSLAKLTVTVLISALAFVCALILTVGLVMSPGLLTVLTLVS